jgi:hypothetical protein
VTVTDDPVPDYEELAGLLTRAGFTADQPTEADVAVLRDRHDEITAALASDSGLLRELLTTRSFAYRRLGMKHLEPDGVALPEERTDGLVVRSAAVEFQVDQLLDALPTRLAEDPGFASEWRQDWLVTLIAMRGAYPDTVLAEAIRRLFTRTATQEGPTS